MNCAGIKLISDDLQGNNGTDNRNADHYEILSEVKAACRTAVQILDDLLCFDKLESGILEIHKHEVPVISFITDCVSMFTSQAKEAGVTMSLIFSQEDVHDESLTSILEGDTVYIDKFKMDQVLRNLISNALKFTPRGGCVSVTASFVLDDRGTTLSRHPAVRLESHKRKSFICSLQSLFCLRRTSRVQSSVQQDIEQCQSSDNIHDMIGHISPKGGDDGDTIHGKLVIVVADTGAGISPANQRRLFNEVVQFNPEVLQAGGGSGLGLWITNSLVGMHNGTVRVHSIGEGMGSSFTAEIEMQRKNLHDSHSIQVAPADSNLRQCELRDGELSQVLKSSGPALPFSTPSTMTTYVSKNFNSHLESSGDVGSEVKISNIPFDILVVDDSSLNRKMLCRVLRTSGHRCDEADDGVFAVDKVKEKMKHVNGDNSGRYDVILMDFVMPNMDGPTATKMIRDLGYSGLIFGVTGNALDSDINYFLDHGADRVLTKPFDYSLFVYFMGMRSM